MKLQTKERKLLKLKDINEQTFNTNLAKNSLIALIDEKPKENTILAAIYISLIVLLPQVVMSQISEPIIFYSILLATISVNSVMTYEIVEKIFKWSKVRRAIYNFTPKEILDRDLTMSEKKVRVLCVLAIACLTFIVPISGLLGPLPFTVVSILVIYIISKCIQIKSNYRYVLKNAPKILNGVELEENKGIERE